MTNACATAQETLLDSREMAMRRWWVFVGRAGV
jgi:hypothetical protein